VADVEEVLGRADEGYVVEGAVDCCCARWNLSRNIVLVACIE